MARNKNKIEKEEKRQKEPKVKLGLAEETKRGVVVVVFVMLALVIFLSSVGVAGTLGAYVFKVLSLIFGSLAYLIPAILLLVAVSIFQQDLQVEHKHSLYTRTYLGAVLLTSSIAGLLHMFYIPNSASAFAVAGSGKGGGYLGAIFSYPLYSFLDFWAGCLILFAFLVIGVLITFDVPLGNLLLWKKKEPKADALAQTVKNTQLKINGMEDSGFSSEKVLSKNQKVEMLDSADDVVPVPKAVKPKPLESTINIGAPQAALVDTISLADRKDWKLPPFDLLEDSKTDVDSGNIEMNVAIIKKTLGDFGIDVEMGEVNVGPTVTQYTLRPTTGVKLSQIAGLQNDLALALAASSLRMELPIPGKSLVGIEVPNKTSAIVRLREVMQTNEFINHKSKLALALGRDVAGHPQLADLTKMPHLLIAGATGTGKSVAINSLLVSLLYRNTPQDVKFIVVDPKRVEMTPYNGIPHLLTPVVTDHEKAVNALKWAVGEMDRRYKLLAEAGKRNILEYNESAGLTLPYIVILVDELADLMAVAQADVEAAIVRLAQMARAVGIHLVLATQRPSVEIITGLIKANITSRIAFAVASQIDSRTILDSSGAEKLLGNGDMLFISADFNKPRRVQGAYIGEKEVKKVVDFFKAQVGAVIYNEEILEKPKRALGIPGFEGSNEGDDDPLLEEAQEEVMRAGKASASLLQRRLRVGYARAARLLDLLEEKGIIGPGDGAKPRDVYGVVPADEKAEYGVENDENLT